MKKVNFNLMNKGGVGKTAYSIFTLAALLKGGRKGFKIVDMDTNNHSLKKRFIGSDYQDYISGASLLSGGENSNMDYSLLQEFFEKLSESPNNEFYCDLGQDDSKAFQKLIRSTGAGTLQEFLEELDIDLTIIPIVKVDDLDSVNYLMEYVKDLDGKINIAVAANMLGVPPGHSNKQRLIDYCGSQGIALNFFNAFDIADGFKAQIHEHLVSGLATPLRLAKGNWNKIIDQIQIP